jgi:hypothetical protein
MEETLISLRTCVQRGKGRRALFLPAILQPSPSPPRPVLPPAVLLLRDALLSVTSTSGVEHVGWYHADEETDASISEPFRRYLDKERLEGRM